MGPTIAQPLITSTSEIYHPFEGKTHGFRYGASLPRLKVWLILILPALLVVQYSTASCMKPFSEMLPFRPSSIHMS